MAEPSLVVVASSLVVVASSLVATSYYTEAVAFAFVDCIPSSS